MAGMPEEIARELAYLRMEIKHVVGLVNDLSKFVHEQQRIIEFAKLNDPTLMSQYLRYDAVDRRMNSR